MTSGSSGLSGVPRRAMEGEAVGDKTSGAGRFAAAPDLATTRRFLDEGRV